MKPLKLKGDGKIAVTIHYVSDETLVQEDEVGNTYVFKKMSDSYPIPYALWLRLDCGRWDFICWVSSIMDPSSDPKQSCQFGVVSVQQ